MLQCDVLEVFSDYSLFPRSHCLSDVVVVGSCVEDVVNEVTAHALYLEHLLLCLVNTTSALASLFNTTFYNKEYGFIYRRASVRYGTGSYNYIVYVKFIISQKN